MNLFRICPDTASEYKAAGKNTSKKTDQQRAAAENEERHEHERVRFRLFLVLISGSAARKVSVHHDRQQISRSQKRGDQQYDRSQDREKTGHLLVNPPMGGIPTREIDAAVKQASVSGIVFPIPGSSVVLRILNL